MQRSPCLCSSEKTRVSGWFRRCQRRRRAVRVTLKAGSKILYTCVVSYLCARNLFIDALVFAAVLTFPKDIASREESSCSLWNTFGGPGWLPFWPG